MSAGGIVLDTNVVSELMRPAPDEAVLAWFAAQDPSQLYLSAISEAELRTGVEVLPAGRRRDALMAAVDAMVAEDFADRLLAFDSDAAKAYASIAAERRSAGRPISGADCQIAAIARARGAGVATRNVRDFAGCGIDVVDPWRGPGIQRGV
jgi:predicted nucleic acid-binding protein